MDVAVERVDIEPQCSTKFDGGEITSRLLINGIRLEAQISGRLSRVQKPLADWLIASHLGFGRHV